MRKFLAIALKEASIEENSQHHFLPKEKNLGGSHRAVKHARNNIEKNKIKWIVSTELSVKALPYRQTSHCYDWSLFEYDWSKNLKFFIKGYITKVIFLCSQARPRMVEGVMWDGKVEIWLIGKMAITQMTSVNRPAGTSK